MEKFNLGSNFRLYTFINFYLSSIQQGIQSAHIVSELFTKYSNSFEKDVLYDWANNHKTIIVLNGGTSFDLRHDYIHVSNFADTLSKSKSNSSKLGRWFLPHAFFTEDFNALGAYDNGVVTGFGIILPEEIWGAQEMPAREIGWAVNYDSSCSHLSYQYYEVGEGGKIVSTTKFWEGEPDTKLIKLLKSKSLAR